MTILLIGIFFLSAAVMAHTETERGSPLSIEALTRRADIVVIGEVVHLESEWNASRTTISTTIDVRAEEVLKGSVEGKKLSFSQLGGTVGGIASSVSGTPSFAGGERVLLFLSRRRDASFGIVGSFQGKFKIEPSEISDSELVVRREPDSGRILDRYPLGEARRLILQSLRR